ncbi:MAG: hypothetical protein H6Q35_2262 [Proteobacteria bacterium]|nr:hypothetical protein [Pseudomonadota bacterium]
MAKKYYWLKLPSNFFVDPKIKKLRKIAGGDTYVIIFLKMMLLVINTNGILEFEGIEKTLEDELSLKLDEDENNVKVVLAFLSSNGELEEVSDEAFLLQRVPDLVGKEGDSAERVRRLRDKKKVELLHCNDIVTECNDDVTQRKRKIEDIEKDIKPSLLLSPSPQRSTLDLKSIKSFREQLSNLCPTLEFSLCGKLGYSNEHKGFCLKSGYIYSLQTKQLVDRNESFEIWQHLFQQKNEIFKYVNTQIQNQNKEENYANNNQ